MGRSGAGPRDEERSGSPSVIGSIGRPFGSSHQQDAFGASSGCARPVRREERHEASAGAIRCLNGHATRSECKGEQRTFQVGEARDETRGYSP